MYDFIIFEHSRLSNHLVDLLSIGKLLKDSGYSVAIVDLDYKSELIADSGFPILKLKCSFTLNKGSKKYWREIVRELSPLSRNFYVGSALSDTSLSWLKYFPPEKNVFIWGLRSFFFTYYKRFQLSRYYPKKFITSLQNLHLLRKHRNICLFISDEVIRDEFIGLGISPNRLVVRRERYCVKFAIAKEYKSNPIKLLVIGSLRPEKRIDLIIDAMESFKPSLNVQLTIAGKAYSIHGYDKMLSRRASQNNSIQRIDRRLDDCEYNKLIHECDFLLLCDIKQPSCVTNGTMAEALLAGRPIIAPNYNPYKFVVEKYGVGLLYNLHDNKSIIGSLKSAIESSPLDFMEGIKRYQTDMMYDCILHQFKKDLSRVLNHN